jgi:DNA primase
VSVSLGDDFKEQVRAATNLVDLVSEVVALTPTRNGSDYVGLCPFHEDRNPSFHVYPDRQSYRCWVCDDGGDCFRWVMEIDRVSFPEALELLAERANLEIPKRQQQNKFNRTSQSDKVTQYEIVEWAIMRMQQALQSGPGNELVQNYVKERSLTEDTVKKFRLGYHPENWTWLLDQARSKFSEKQLLSVGLVGERPNAGGYYDNLVGRLIFPIIDERNRPVAFGGRVLPGSNIESPAKYWNCPETDIFRKRKTLYAFDHARDSIKKNGVIVTEGYMDCIACHQAGVTNAVATLGTALTEDHVRFLKRFTNKVVLVYDGDEAGQRAAEKVLERFLAQDLDLRVISLEEGQDPADYLEKHGKEPFEQLVREAPEAWEFKLKAAVERFGLDSVAGRQQVLNDMIGFLAAAPGMAGSMREDLIVRTVSQRTTADEAAIRRQLQEARSQKTTRLHFQTDRRDTAPPPEPVIKTHRGTDLAEREVLEIILTRPDLTDYIRHQIGPGDFENPQHRRLLELCFDLLTEEGLLPEPVRIIAAVDSDSALLSLINALLDSAGEKGLSNLLTDQPIDQQESSESDATTAEVPLHLERVLDPLRQRRAKNQNLMSKQQLAQTNTSSSKLNSDTVDALRRIFKNRQSQMGDQPPTLK